MKKLIIFLTLAIISFGAFACGGSSSPTTSTDTTTTTEDVPESDV